jgi:pimeloyl-ACP methyl ester carboxylesterase
MATIELAQGRVHYRVAGPKDSAAPPVVFVHGLLVNSELWSQVMADLSERGIRSYAPDLPLGGHPEALAADADLSPRGVARLILDFLAALDLTDVTLVGNDTGGALCQFVIDTDSSRIGRLLLTNCDAFDQFPPAPFGVLVKMGSRPGRIRMLTGPMRLTALRHGPLGFGPLVRTPLDAGMTRRWIEPLADAGVRRDAARFMAAIDKRELLDVSTRLGSFDKPVRLVWGDADRFFKISFAERLASIFPNAQLVPVPGGRTFLSLDEPDVVAAQIADFAQVVA